MPDKFGSPGYARVLAHALSDTRALDRALADAAGFAAAVLDSIACALDEADAAALELARAHASDLARACNRACNRAEMLARADGVVRVLVLTQTLATQMRAQCRDVADLIGDLEHSAESAFALAPQQRVQVSRMAMRITGMATGILPHEAQARYREECGVELYELARISRSAQWRYAANLLGTAWPLRRELRRAGLTPVPRRWRG